MAKTEVSLAEKTNGKQKVTFAFNLLKIFIIIKEVFATINHLIYIWIKIYM